MAQTYSQIQRQIDKLQRQAEVLRNREVGGVIDRIKVAIAHYGLTADQLGFGTATGARQMSKKGRTSAAPSPAIKFSDGNGNAWSGRGPRPAWLRAALESGRTLEEFAASSGADGASPSAVKPASTRSKRKKRAPSTKLYSDGAGHTWTGRGPKPAWLKVELAAGKSLEDFSR